MIHISKDFEDDCMFLVVSVSPTIFQYKNY